MSARRHLWNTVALTAIVGLGVTTGLFSFLWTVRTGSAEAAEDEPGWIVAGIPTFWVFTAALAAAAWLLVVPAGLVLWRHADTHRATPRALLAAALIGGFLGPFGPLGLLLAIPVAWLVLFALARHEHHPLPVDGLPEAGDVIR